jgi:hypothetical protein
MIDLPSDLAAFARFLDAHLCSTIPTLPVGMGRCRQPKPGPGHDCGGQRLADQDQAGGAALADVPGTAWRVTHGQ